MFFDAMRIVRAVDPRMLVLENVPGMLTSNNGLDFAVVLREVGEGWGCEEVAWRMLDSQFFGVAQRRKRCFVVASSRIGCAEEVLALSEGMRWDLGEEPPKGQDAPAGSEGGAGADGCGGREKFSSVIIDRAAYNQGKNALYDTKIVEDTHMPALVARGPHAVAFRKTKRAQSSTDNESWIEDDKANTINGFDIGDARATQVIREPNMVVRRLTPTETELLQGFPAGWTDVGTSEKPTADSRRYKQMGNAVTVNVAQWIAERAYRVLCSQGDTNAQEAD